MITTVSAVYQGGVLRGAVRWCIGYAGILITTGSVIDETLTPLRSRGHGAVAFQFGADIFAGKLCQVHYLSRTEIAAAWQVFQRYRDKGWSFTDCASKVVIESFGIPQAFTFDQHFRQFGSVAVAP